MVDPAPNGEPVEGSALFGWVRDPRAQAALDLLLIVLLVVAAWNTYQTYQGQQDLKAEAEQRAKSAFGNCQAANDSRQVIVNVLMAGEQQVKHNQDATPEQRDRAVAFYEEQIAAIKFSDCSIYKLPV